MSHKRQSIKERTPKERPPTERTPRVVRKTAGDNPPEISKPLPPGSVSRSPLSKDVELQAQQLIHETGSTNAAKTAVEVAAERERVPDFQEDHFAQRWGFGSRAEMRAASKPISAGDGGAWWATQLANGRWVVWNKDDLKATSTFASLEEVRSVMDGGGK
jgi:hypothetical protein